MGFTVISTDRNKALQSVNHSLRSKCFHGVKSEERGFQHFSHTKNGARTKISKTPKTLFFALCSTEMLATVVRRLVNHYIAIIMRTQFDVS